MKFVSIGDVHGSERWKTLLFGETPTIKHISNVMSHYDKVIFVGDYVDSFDKNAKIVDNLLEIIQLKKDYDDKVILLWGNHDVFYYTMNYGRDHVSGIRPELFHELNQIFSSNYKLFQFSYQYKNYIWTHTGIHRGWWEHYVMPKINGKKESRFHKYLTGDENISDILNLMFEFQEDELFMISHLRMKNGIGGKRVGGPLWAHDLEIYKKPLLGYHQIYGHTHKKCIKHYESKHHKYSITNVDCLEESEKLYKIEI